mgnify:CR=1 FL=1
MAPKEPTPRTRIVPASCPGFPLSCVIVTPESWPVNSQATELPELARSYEYAEYYNMAIGKETYTPEMIQKYRDGSDPDNYANEMYLEDLLGGHALQTKHELSASGGTEKIQYMASLGYLHQDGLLDNNYYNRYNARVNLNAELAKNLKLSVRLSGMASDRHEPSTPGSMDGGGYM